MAHDTYMICMLASTIDKEAHLAFSLLKFLDCDGEDGVGAAGVLIHHCCSDTPVLLTNLHVEKQLY